MSMPVIPDLKQSIPIEDALSLILVSIAMEELGLSHILKAEGEKIKYAIESEASMDEAVAINNSVSKLVDSVTRSQHALKDKMKSVLESIGCEIGPTGPTGPTGPIGPKGECVHKNKCCVVSFNGRHGQCWREYKPLHWTPSDRDDCCAAFISDDGRHINLRGGRCFVINFSINASAKKPCDKAYPNPLTVSVQLNSDGRHEELFLCRAAQTQAEHYPTLSSAGIYVTVESDSYARLSLILQSPGEVYVRQSSICVTEI